MPLRGRGRRSAVSGGAGRPPATIAQPSPQRRRTKGRRMDSRVGEGATNRDRSAFRSLIRLRAETSAILLALWGLVA